MRSWRCCAQPPNARRRDESGGGAPLREIDQIWQQSDVLTGEKALARNTIRTRTNGERAKRQSEVASSRATKKEKRKKRRGEKRIDGKIFVILFSARSVPLSRSKIRRRHRDVIEADPTTNSSGRESQCTLSLSLSLGRRPKCFLGVSLNDMTILFL